MYFSRYYNVLSRVERAYFSSKRHVLQHLWPGDVVYKMICLRFGNSAVACITAWSMHRLEKVGIKVVSSSLLESLAKINRFWRFVCYVSP